jgi:hypothetical protein
MNDDERDECDQHAHCHGPYEELNHAQDLMLFLDGAGSPIWNYSLGVGFILRAACWVVYT